ncbi:scavenger receptor cysteine-rich domain-containing protein DMBT1-like [Amphiura filiformis]|uniref:scavenger receptor cysteine-rich domain-containing protein DMBT1-like n=1 Tax=Amphiura filiformis TaxID=82378 RepID=UPI003B217807
MDNMKFITIVMAIHLAVLAMLVYGASASAIRDLKKRDASHCTDDTFMKNDRCVPICGPGYFGDKNTRMCKPCVAPCKTCVDSASTCTSCTEESQYLLGNACVADCGIGYYSKGPARSRLRLQGGSNNFEGRVEVLHEGVWGTICDDDWSVEDAKVVCRELQLGTALEAVRAEDAGFEPAPLRTPILVDDINCFGAESKLEFCQRREWGEHNCAHFEDAGVRCSGPDVSQLCVKTCGDGYYRVPNTNRCELCSEDCRTCQDSADHCLSCEHPRFLRDAKCMENCGVNFHGNTWTRICEKCHENCLNCIDDDQNDICTSCRDGMYLKDGKCVSSCDPKLAKNLAIRLADGPSEYEGRVEVYVDGEWGTVCDDEWDILDAEVVCRELGYGHAVAAINAPAFGPGRGNVLMDDIDCDGNEAELIHCRQKPWGQNDCNHHEDAGVRCQGNTAMETMWGPIRPELTNGATGKCLDDCGTGYYLKDDYNCMSCAAQCLSCNDSPDQCTACKPPYFLQGNQCIDQCAPLEYGNTLTRRCEPCDLSQCARCADGESNNNCTQCAAGTYLKGATCVAVCGPDMYRQNETCVPECDAGLYGNPVTFLCQACPSSCYGCAFDAISRLQCTSCVAPKIFSNGQCLDSCPPETYSALVESANLPSNSELRLVGGNNQLEGRLEVFHANQWGTICNDFWDMDAAHVACQELNLGYASAILSLSEDINIVAGEGLIWLDNVICLGQEKSLSDCYHQEWGQQDHCNHQKDVAIRCTGPGIRECLSTCPVGQYANSTSQSCNSCHAYCEECASNPNYTCTKCAEGTHLKGSECVSDCGQGHYRDEEAKECIECSERCASCDGHANRCTSCSPEYFLQGSDCVTECDDYKLLVSDSVRITPGPLLGRVEVLHQGQYGTVCDDQWNLRDAEVVCQMLGLGHALEAIPEGRAGTGYGAIVLDDVDCIGNETSLLSCKNAGLGNSDCQHEEDAGVRCSGPMTSNVCISRADCASGFFAAPDGKSCGVCSGNCKTCSESADHCTSCPTGQYLSDSNVCVETCQEGFYGDDDGTCKACSSECHDCLGTQLYCISCPTGKYLDNTTHTCVEDCNGKYLVEGARNIRLAGSEEPFKGRVELLHEGTWGTVCDDTWDIHDAEVVCRQLGMGSAVNVFTQGHFGLGSGMIWMDDVECNGDERMLMQCRQHILGPGNTDCTHQEDAGVECSGPDSSLVCVSECGDGSLTTIEFHLQAYMPLNELFFTKETLYKNFTIDWSYVFVQPPISVLPQDSHCEHCDPSCMACNGLSTDCTSCRAPNYLNGTKCIPDCGHDYYGNTNTRQCERCDEKCDGCFDGHANNRCKNCASGLYLEGGECVESCATGIVLQSLLPDAPSTKQVRLTGGSSPHEGLVEVFHDGQWGTVCMNGWDLDDAEVVCQELGLGRALDIPRSWRYGQSDIRTPIWMNDVNCIGWENSIVQCSQQGWGEGNCDPRHTQDAAVVCDGSDYRRPSKNVCREEQEGPCRRDSCYSRVTCVDLPQERSVCLECPEGMLGDGKNCTSIATEPPKFKAMPENRTARVGFAASLSCVADGENAPPITAENWLKDGQPISNIDLNSQRLRVLSYGNLHFVRTRREDTGVYSCVLRNTMGTVSANATLTVQEPPQILMVKHGVVAVGDTAELACMIGGLPLSNVSWHSNGKSLNEGRYTNFKSNGTLLIENVTIADEGSYTCVAENPLGIDHATVSLTVNEPPVFTETPQNATSEEGAEVTLKCQATGKPKPSILWKKDGDDLPHVANNKYILHETGYLTITNMERADMGIYACIAFNPVQPLTAFTTVLVKGLPHVLSPPKNESLSTGETVIIPCKVIGAPAPKVTWEKNGLPLEEGGRYKFLSEGLQINGTNAADTGLYTCVAVNEEGEVTSSAQIQVSGEIIYGTHKM